MTFSFLHIADIHLDRPFSNLNEYSTEVDISSLYKQAVQKSFFNAIDFAIAKNVDFVLIAGDTFDSEEQDFESKLILKDGLKKLEEADIKVFVICGNHDPLSSYNKVTFNFSENSNIKIIGLNTENKTKFIVSNKDNKEIAIVRALSFENSVMEENPTKYFEIATNEDKKLFNIGLLHCDLDSIKTSPYAPCKKSELEEKNYDYWALGHIHIPNIEETNICYAGTIQGRNTKEFGPHGFKYIKVENGKISKNTFVSSDVIRYENIDIDLSSIADETNAMIYIEDQINEFINQKNNSNCEMFLFKLNLVGIISFYDKINDEFFKLISERIKSNLFGKVYISEFFNNTTSKVDEMLLLEDDGLAGTLYSTIQKTQNIDEIYNQNIEKIKKLMKDCEFTEEEIENLEKEAKLKAKETCVNLCSQVYGNESKEDNL